MAYGSTVLTGLTRTLRASGVLLFAIAACSGSGEEGPAGATRGDAHGGTAGVAGERTGGSAGVSSGGTNGNTSDASAGASGGSAGASGAAGALGGAGNGGQTATADSVWSPLSVMAIVNPKDHGAVGNGSSDDLAALSAAVNALPSAGGIVYLPDGAIFKKTNLLVVTKPHVKFWAINRNAEIFQSIAGQTRHQSIICRRNPGCGFFGIKFRSDGAARFDALEDNQISADHGSLVEVAGCEIQGSAAAGVFLYGSSEHYIEGNYIHHTWADHIHHTEGARQSWVWSNFIVNDAPSRGDDGVACVTYGPSSTRCADMEWWKNTILHSGWGRGYSVIGGNNIKIHHNWAIGVAGAGIIVASEGSYNSSSSDGVSIDRNYVYQCGHSIGHPGILVSGMNPAAPPLNDIALTDNVAVDNPNGSYRAEGAYTNVTNSGLATTAAGLPTPIPTLADVRMADTSILRTRDTSHVAAAFRPGLYRIHVRRAPSGSGFEQRFEYVFRGAAGDVSAFVAARSAAGDYLSERRMVGGTEYALLLSSAPITIASTLSAVSFQDLRAGDATGDLSWLWQRVDSGTY